LVFAYLAALAPALLMALTQPVWSRVDEAQHYDFIVQLSHGVYPVADTTPITPETLSVSEATGVYRVYPRGSYPTPDLSDWGLPPPGMSDRANAAWMQRHMWQLSHESVQTPGYYLLMVPIDWIFERLGGPFAAIFALRLINALLVAALAPMAVVVARTLMPARHELTALAAGFVILLPGLDLNLTRVSNDTLSAVLGGLLVLLAIRWAGNGWTWRRAALVGILLGVGLTVKLTVAGVFPAVAISILWPGGASTWRGRIAMSALICLIAVACLAPWFALNLHIFNGLTPGARVARISDSVPKPFSAGFVLLDIAVFVLTYWAGEPWGVLPFAGALAVLGGLIALMALAGIIKQLRSRTNAVRSGPLAVAIASVAVMVGLTLFLPATGGFEFVAPGRYAYPALPAAASLCALGLCTVVAGAGARRLVVAAYGALSIVMLAAGAVSGPPEAAGSGTPPPTARILAVQAAGQRNGFAIRVDQLALDDAAHAIWVEVSVTNSGSSEAEWGVVPLATTNNEVVSGDYSRSTQLPGDIEPGSTVTGWLYIPLDPSRLRATGSVTLRFVDVASNDYRAVGDIDLFLRLAGT
jgi:hypothetical protein